jgi:GMP synthase (glutamine-hydrolysing)
VSRVLVIVNDPSDPPGPLGNWLSEAGLQLVVIAAHSGVEIPSLDGFDGLLVLGGSASANDDALAPWLPAVRSLLARAVHAELPTLGICLGGQLLAVATGGRVERSPEGPEYGAQLIAKRASASTDPLFGPMPITPDVIQWHVDAIAELPPGAVLLANSPSCEVQAFRVGRLAWGTQFHIETTPEIVRLWADEDAELLEGYDLERMLTRSDAAHADIAEVWQPFARAWAAIVEDPASVRPARPLRISTAEPITDPAEIRAALAAQMQAARPQGLPWPAPAPSGCDPLSGSDPSEKP